MPGLRPTPPEPEPNDNGSNNKGAPVDFSYMTLKSSTTGQVLFAMTFQQIIEFLDEVTDTLSEGEESAMFHLNQIKRVLRRYIKHGDGNNH